MKTRLVAAGGGDALTAAVAETGKAIRRPGARPASVRSLLLWLMLACLLPGMLGATAILYYSFLNERAQLVQDTNQTTRALMQAVDAEFARIQALTQALAKSEHLASNDLAAFHAQALEFSPLTKFDHNYILVDSTGQQLLNTLRPYPSQLSLIGNLELVRQVFTTGQPAISGVYIGAVRKQHVMALEVPVWQQGRVRYALSFATVPATFLGEVLKKQQLPPDWVVSFFDAQGTIAFRTHEADRFVGQKVAPGLLARLPGETNGMVETNTLEGIHVSAVFSRSPTSNWGVVIGIPTQSFTAKLYQRFAWLSAGLGLLLAVGVVLALTLAKRIGGSIRALTAPALALGNGEAVTVPRVYLREAEEVGEAIATASNLLLRAETMRVASESKLTATLQRLDAHLHNSPLAIIEFDPRFHVQRWSVEAERLFGWPEAEILGRAKLDIHWVHEDDVEKVHRSWAELSSGAQTKNMCSNRNYRQDGTVVDCEWHNSALHDENGNLTSILSQVLDVSDRNRANAALAIAKSEAEQASQAKSAFLASMSHEIRTPLNGIIGTAQIGLRATDAVPARAYLEQVQESGQLLLALVDDILDVAKVEAGKLELEIGPVRLSAILQRAIRLTKASAALKGIAFSLECAADLPEAILTDDTRLTQVLVNLLGNAIKFTAAGKVVLQARTAASHGRPWLVFAIQDTGIGMSEVLMARLFQPFEQGDASTTRRFGGSGLGLTISKRIVDLMGGSIEVASQEGQGACFTVRVPLETAALPLVDEPATHQALTGTRRLEGFAILAAEDDKVNQWVLQQLLEQEGAHCVVKDDGLAALEVLDGPDLFDVFLTDVQMPGLDGYETARRSRALHPDLPVIGLTAYALPEERRRCLEAGMAAHVSKPVDIDTLVATILRLVTPWAVGAVEESTASTASAGASDQPVDWPTLEKRMVKAAVLRKTLESLLQHHADTPAELRRRMLSTDPEPVRVIAHNLRGIAGMLAANPTRQAAENLEDSIRNTRALAPEKAEHLASCLDTLLTEVRAYHGKAILTADG